jgi:hypothetical protein
MSGLWPKGTRAACANNGHMNPDPDVPSPEPTPPLNNPDPQPGDPKPKAPPSPDEPGRQRAPIELPGKPGMPERV